MTDADNNRADNELPASEPSQRRQGKTIILEDEGLSATASRQAKVFMLDQDNDLTQAPDSITTPVSDGMGYQGLTLTALPIKGIKSLLIGVVSIFAVMSVWQIYTLFETALALHWLVAAGFAGLIIIVSGLALRSVISFMADKANMSALQGIQDQAEQLKATNDIGKAKDFIAQLTAFYQDKPQQALLLNSLKMLPDYSNDKEAIAHLEQTFLVPLDQEALRRVSKYSVQTGIVVAASPWASVDMLLALWRSMKMIDEVGQVYGMRPSLTNRYKLLQQVLRYLALIGVSEVAIDEMLQEFGTSSLAGITGARLGQGVGAGVYTARIGLAAVKSCRPIAFAPAQQPKLKDFITRILQRMNG